MHSDVLCELVYIISLKSKIEQKIKIICFLYYCDIQLITQHSLRLLCIQRLSYFTPIIPPKVLRQKIIKQNPSLKVFHLFFKKLSVFKHEVALVIKLLKMHARKQISYSIQFFNFNNGSHQ